MINPNTPIPDERYYSRNQPITCKVSPKDLAEIEAKALQAGKSRSGFMRESALNATVVPAVTVPAINQQQWEELARVTSNLNQLTLLCHLNKEHPSSDKVISQIAEARNLLHEVRQALIGNEPKGGK